jgi:hypothetical protein
VIPVANNKALLGIFLVAAILPLAYFYRERKSRQEATNDYEFAVIVPSYSPGDLYSVKDEHGFKIVKVLVNEQDVLHIRIYKNLFRERPEHADQIKLILGSIEDPHGFGIGHMPISKSEFSSWQPEFIAHSKVTPEELEGYQLWKQSNGGVFGH